MIRNHRIMKGIMKMNYIWKMLLHINLYYLIGVSTKIQQIRKNGVGGTRK